MEIIAGRQDFDTTIRKAFDEIDPKWEIYTGLVVVGSHLPENIENKIRYIKIARQNNIPFLGICLGFQLALIEYARNVLDYKAANSIEVNSNTCWPIIIKMPNPRIGAYQVEYNKEIRLEDHWHNYYFNQQYSKDYIDEWQFNWTEDVLEIGKLSNHKFFMGTQFHPEYTSSAKNPHPILKQFIDECKK